MTWQQERRDSEISYPPSSSSKNDKQDLIQALDAGPPLSSNAERYSISSQTVPDLPPFAHQSSSSTTTNSNPDFTASSVDSYSPPNSATISTFEHPLLAGTGNQPSRSSASQRSVDDFSMTQPYGRRGSAPVESAIGTRSKAPRRNQEAEALPPLPQNFTAKGMKRNPSANPAFSVQIKQSPSSGMPPYLVRSTIPINPFATLRRRLFQTRSGKERPEHQLIQELLQSLDDYLAVFEAPSPSSSPVLSVNAALKVKRAGLPLITDEIENLVLEIVEQVPEFQQACSRGNYGPLAIPNAQLASGGHQSSTDRFGAYEPETVEELLSGQFWDMRLRRDLSDSSSDDGSAISSPVSSYSPFFSTSPRTPDLGRFEDGLHSHSMQRTESARSQDLLRQGQQRWESWQRKRSGSIALEGIAQ